MLKIIFTYNRPELLIGLLTELTYTAKDSIVIIDDGSDYDPTQFMLGFNYYRVDHKGKAFFWQNWNFAFTICQASDHDHFLFVPDDWYDFDIDRIEWLQNMFKDNPYAFNIANHGVSRQWTPIEAWHTTIKEFDAFRVGFVDCCFSTNRAALERLEWKMNSIYSDRFKDPRMSSGVGKQLSKRFLKRGVPMLKPVKSLCKKHHVESQMNPEERIKNPRPLV